MLISIERCPIILTARKICILLPDTQLFSKMEGVTFQRYSHLFPIEKTFRKPLLIIRVHTSFIYLELNSSIIIFEKKKFNLFIQITVLSLYIRRTLNGCTIAVSIQTQFKSKLFHFE